MNIQIYTNKVQVFVERDTANVWLNNVDPSQVLSEFSAKDKLESIELDDIYAYLDEIGKK